MKHTVVNHPKTRKLKRLLRLPLFHILGLLEGLWQLTAEYATDGGIGRMDNDEIADWLEYDGDPQELIDAFIEAKWLDHDEAARLVVHDWIDHCPDYVKKRIRRQSPTTAGRSKPPPTADGGSQRRTTAAIGENVRPTQRNATEPNGTQPNPTEVKASVISATAESDAKPSAKEFFDRWDEWVKNYGKGRVKRSLKLTKQREKQIRARLRDDDWWVSFQSAIKLLPLSSSENHPWQPNLDWLIRNQQNVYRLLEGDFSWRTDSSAVKRLDQLKREKAAREREEKLKQEKLECTKAASGTRKAIRDTFSPPSGKPPDDEDSTLLFG